MRVSVMTPSRNKMLLDGVATLRDVKRLITTKTGIPARLQLIYFRGKQLKSLRRPLTAYHVREDSTLFLVKRLGICRCLACRNSRYIEREEMEEERQLLHRLLGASASVDDGHRSASEVISEVTDATGGRNTATGLVDSDGVNQRQTLGLDVSPDEQEAAALEAEESDVEVVGEDDIATEAEEDLLEEEEMEEADEDAVEVEEDADEVEEEEEEIEQTDGGAEDGAEEMEEATEGADDVEDEEEAMDEAAGETEDLNEETAEIDAAEEDLELSGEDADDEEEPDVAEEEEDTEIIEVEDIEDEPLNDPDDEPTEEEPEDANEEDESATILYSLVTGREDNPRREELELATAATGDEEEEDVPAEPVFARQAAFEEDGANSVGEEEPDVTDLEDEEDVTLAADRWSPEEDAVPERVEDLLLAMTRPTPDPDREEDPLEEQYPEDDPLFDPPDEEDPLLAPRDEDDAGYISGDEMDHA